MVLIKLQIGKNGLTEGFIETVRHFFVRADSIRISVLKSGSRDKEEIKKWTATILEKLGKNFTAKIIGYTIVLRKWRKARTTKECKSSVSSK